MHDCKSHMFMLQDWTNVYIKHITLKTYGFDPGVGN